MFRVVTAVIVHPTAEARQALGAQLQPAGLAAWRHIALQGQGLEFAHLGFSHAGIALALSSRLRRDGLIVVEIGLGRPQDAARAITATQYRRAAGRHDRSQGGPR